MPMLTVGGNRTVGRVRAGAGTGSAVADPTQLPLATGQLPGAGTYGRGQAAGFTYTDPVGGVSVLKLTDNTSPAAGSHEHPYATGGPNISLPWTSGSVTYYTVVCSTGYLVDVRYDTMAPSNYRAVPYDGEVGIAFSLNASTPRICYVVDGTQIRRYNTETNAYADTGFFPFTVPGSRTNIAWLQTQVNDTWIVCMAYSDNAFIAFRQSDGASRVLTEAESGTSHDEPHLDLTDAFVYVSQNSTAMNLPWDLVNDTVAVGWSQACTSGGGNMSDDHATPLRGGMAAWAIDGTPYGGAYYLNRATGDKVRFIQGDAGFHGGNNDAYHSGYGNAYGFQGSFTDQWFAVDRFINDSASEKIRAGVIAMVKLTNDVRFLCAHDSVAAVYARYPQTCMSPDGKLALWTSDQNASGRTDTFLAFLPVG